MGENGSGKSTLVGIVSGTVVRDSGTLEIAGTTVTSARPSIAHRHGAITVFQDGSLIGELTVARTSTSARAPRTGRPTDG